MLSSGNDPAYPECVTYELIAGLSTYSSFGCDSTSAFYVLATTPLDTSSITTAFSTSFTTSSTSLPSITSIVHTSSSTAASTPVTTPTITPTASPTSNNHVAAIAGGVVGGVAGLALIIGAISFIMYRVKKKRDEAANDDVPEMTGYVQN
jgi:hypothetical protein